MLEQIIALEVQRQSNRKLVARRAEK